MKTAISIPETIFRSAEQLARRLSVSRSALYAKAVAELIDKHRDDLVTSRLNEIYDADNSALDPEIAHMQYRSIAGKKR